jgi:hypothetical protein
VNPPRLQVVLGREPVRLIFRLTRFEDPIEVADADE